MKPHLVANADDEEWLGLSGTALRWRLSSPYGPGLGGVYRTSSMSTTPWRICARSVRREDFCLIVMVVHMKTGRTALLYTNSDKKFVYDADGGRVLSTPETKMMIPPMGLSLHYKGAIELVRDEDDDDMLSFAVSLDIRSNKPVSPSYLKPWIESLNWK